MRNSHVRGGSLAVIAGLSLTLAACGGGSSEATNAADANAMDANLMFEEPANDASALESVANVTETSPVTNLVDEAGNEAGPLGETSGGDTGGNTVESNVAGM